MKLQTTLSLPVSQNPVTVWQGKFLDGYLTISMPDPAQPMFRFCVETQDSTTEGGIKFDRGAFNNAAEVIESCLELIKSFYLNSTAAATYERVKNGELTLH